MLEGFQILFYKIYMKYKVIFFYVKINLEFIVVLNLVVKSITIDF